MDSFKESQRQIRIALLAVAVILPIGIVGFMLIERFSILDSVWLTVITLATIGYGDIYARTEAGRVFTVFLILFGLGAVAYGLQATATFFLSPAIRDLRRHRHNERVIAALKNHYIVCGSGELVDNTIQIVLGRAKRRIQSQQQRIEAPIENLLQQIFGDSKFLPVRLIRLLLKNTLFTIIHLLNRQSTILDSVVVVTPDSQFAEHLRQNKCLVIEGDPTNNDILIRAGIAHAQAMMVILDNDTEVILTILTARNLSAELEITAAAVDDHLAAQMIRVGANNVLAHYDVAGSFLNNITLRPAVNDFFSSILLNEINDVATIELYLGDSASWVGQRIDDLQLQDRFHAAIIGIRLEDGTYRYAPSGDVCLNEGEIVIAVVPVQSAQTLYEDCHKDDSRRKRIAPWQRMPPHPPLIHKPARIYTLQEAETAVQEMSHHFVICGTNRVARNAINKLDPNRPFVIISDDTAYITELIERGFRVIQGRSTDETILHKAGLDRALAVMVAMEDNPTSVLTILNCRTISKKLLITTTAQTNDMIPKLHRAGADRVITPYQVAAAFILLATTRPAVNDFLQYVLFNRAGGIETTELYMQTDSPWIGQSIQSLHLADHFEAGVIGLRDEKGHYHYAPSIHHIVQPHDVLIVVTPMKFSDLLRERAHGNISTRPLSLRRVQS
ncbi:MAG: NAD-binding protein [Anaerolineae bacterium]|nr:NAD-binding protein [Anaerolineae bacterium]